jgi:hypothetical protein
MSQRVHADCGFDRRRFARRGDFYRGSTRSQSAAELARRRYVALAESNRGRDEPVADLAKRSLR